MIEKVLKSIYYVIIGVVAGLLVIALIPNQRLNVFVVESGSMEPAIKTGAVVIVRSADDYTVGEIITFDSSGGRKDPTTHRLVGIQDGRYITKGDANENEDLRTTEKSEVIGKVVIDIPYLGYVLAFARTTLGLILILVIPAGVIVFDEIYKIYKEIKKRKNDKGNK